MTGSPADREGLIVQRLDDELLVYDTDSDEAHCLGPQAVAEFEAAPDDVSRREVIRKLALVGALAAGAAPLVKTVAAPTPALAQSANCGPLTCTPAQTCCLGSAATGSDCCDPGESCCNGVCFNPATETCCAGTFSCLIGNCCSATGACLVPCQGNCVGGTCS